MMGTKEIPELVTEFVAMSKEYLRQETVGRAKLVGRHTGVGMGAAFASALAIIFLSVAGVRLLIDAMPGEPDHQMWSGLAYVIGALVLGLVAAIIVGRVSK
jgi:xanthine/uracil/vitamin C permease (AzgA family)